MSDSNPNPERIPVNERHRLVDIRGCYQWVPGPDGGYKGSAYERWDIIGSTAELEDGFCPPGEVR